MAEGYFPLYRKIQDHWLWTDRPFSKGQAWVDLLLMANHCDNKFALGNEVIQAEKGQVVTSEQKLMMRWGWSKTKVRAFLELLESEKMLIKNSDKKKTTLTLCNYKAFNDSSNHEKTIKEPQKDPINNVDNDNKNNTTRRKAPSVTFESTSKPYQCAKYLDERICERLPEHQPATEKQLQSWCAEFDKVNRLDKKSWRLIGETLEFSQEDEFWKKQILSAGNFRKHFEKMCAKMGGGR